MAITSVAITGAGMMGGGIAIGCISAGVQAHVINVDGRAFSRKQDRICNHFRRLVEKGEVTSREANNAEDCLLLFNRVEAVQGAHLIIEAFMNTLGPSATRATYNVRVSG